MTVLLVGLYILGFICLFVFYLVFAFKMHQHVCQNPRISEGTRKIWKVWLYYGGFLPYALFGSHDLFIRLIAGFFIACGITIVALYHPIHTVLQKEMDDIYAEIKTPKWIKDQVRLSIRPSARSVPAGMPIQIIWQVLVEMKSTAVPQINFDGFKEPPSFGGLKHEEQMPDDSEQQLNIVGNSFKKKILKKYTVTSERSGQFKIAPGIIRLRLTYPDSGESFLLESTTEGLKLEFN